MMKDLKRVIFIDEFGSEIFSKIDQDGLLCIVTDQQNFYFQNRKQADEFATILNEQIGRLKQ